MQEQDICSEEKFTIAFRASFIPKASHKLLAIIIRKIRLMVIEDYIGVTRGHQC